MVGINYWINVILVNAAPTSKHFIGLTFWIVSYLKLSISLPIISPRDRIRFVHQFQNPSILISLYLISYKLFTPPKPQTIGYSVWYSDKKLNWWVCSAINGRGPSIQAVV
jgi:hypothetical protein